MDTSPRYKNDNQTGQFGNQRTVTVAGARETICSQECRKPKRVKDSTYHKEKMLMCKQAEKGVPLQAEQADWLEDTDEEIDEQEFEAHYSFMEKIQEVPTADSGTDTEPLEQVQYDDEYNVFANEIQHSEQPKSISNTCVVEKVDSNVIPDLPDMCDNDIQTDQNVVKCDDERVVLANLIANLKFNIDENKKIQKQLKKANTSLAHELKEELVDQAWEKHSHDHFRAPTAHDMEILIKTCLMSLAIKTQNDSFTFVHELKQEMHADLKYIESIEKEIDELEYDKAEFSNMYDILLQECVSNDVMSQLQDKNIAICELKKLIEICKGKSVEIKFDKPSVIRQPNAQRIPKPSVLGKPTPFSDSLERKIFSKTKSVPKTNVSEGLSKLVTTQILPQTARNAVRNTNVIKPDMYRIDTRTTQTRAPQLP
ncbi:hypothetical protein Tco_0879188 [Tanacetum coccineum]